MPTSRQLRAYQLRTRMVRRIEAKASSPAAFQAAVDAELGELSSGRREVLRQRILAGRAWMPVLRFASNRTLRGADWKFQRSLNTVCVHEDLAQNDDRVGDLFRAAVREYAIPPAPGLASRFLGWCRAAA